jgi:hypothetical protein
MGRLGPARPGHVNGLCNIIRMNPPVMTVE